VKVTVPYPVGTTRHMGFVCVYAISEFYYCSFTKQILNNLLQFESLPKVIF